MRTLETAQSTMEKLLAERKKREKELDLLRTSEPRLMNELSTLRESMVCIVYETLFLFILQLVVLLVNVATSRLILQ